MNIHLRACPRCGGDIDAALRDDVRCVQCGHRIYEPAVGLRDRDRPRGRVSVLGGSAPCRPQVTEGYTLTHFDTHRYIEPKLDLPGRRPDPDAAASPCPRCRSVDLIPLDRLSPDHNLCLRCRLCGHIFSPPAA